MVIFPQGGILGIEAEFARGAFALARTLRRPILPVALTGSHRVWEHPYSPRLRLGERVSLRVLPPIPLQRVLATPEDDLRRELQRTLKAEALEGRMALPRRFVPERDGFWDGYAYRIDPAFPELAAQVRRHREERARQGPAAA
jgi:1-acyl-sn-glycerol-3-phosphate acyltransferase